MIYEVPKNLNPMNAAGDMKNLNIISMLKVYP